MTDRDEIEKLRADEVRGRQAKNLLENEIFNEAGALLARRILDKFAETNPRDVTELQYQRQMLQALQDFRDVLRQLIMDGENATTLLQGKKSTFHDYPGALGVAQQR